MVQIELQSKTRRLASIGIALHNFEVNKRQWETERSAIRVVELASNCIDIREKTGLSSPRSLSKESQANREVALYRYLVHGSRPSSELTIVTEEEVGPDKLMAEESKLRRAILDYIDTDKKGGGNGHQFLRSELAGQPYDKQVHIGLEMLDVLRTEIKIEHLRTPQISVNGRDARIISNQLFSKFLKDAYRTPEIYKEWLAAVEQNRIEPSVALAGLVSFIIGEGRSEAEKLKPLIMALRQKIDSEKPI